MALDDNPDIGDLAKYLANIDPQAIRSSLGVGGALQGMGPGGQAMGNAMTGQGESLLKNAVGLQQAMALGQLRSQAMQNVAGIKGQYGLAQQGMKGQYGLEQQGMKNVSAENIADKRIRAAMMMMQARGNEFYVDPQGNHWLQNKISGEVRPVPAPGAWMMGEAAGQQPGMPNINVSVNTGGQQQGGAPGQFVTPKNLTPAQQKDVAGFDAAENRLNMLEQFIRNNPDVRTYKGAAVLHGVAQLPGMGWANDPRFGQLETLSGEHLLKGIKSDVGGRISNFEIKYGEGIFPNTNLQPQENLARIQTIRSLLENDRQNYLQTAAMAGQRTQQYQKGAQQPQTAPATGLTREQLMAKYAK